MLVLPALHGACTSTTSAKCHSVPMPGLGFCGLAVHHPTSLSSRTAKVLGGVETLRPGAQSTYSEILSQKAYSEAEGEKRKMLLPRHPELSSQMSLISSCILSV